MEGAVVIPRFVSVMQPIRLALGKLGFGDLANALEPDLVAWAVEGMDKIQRTKRAAKKHSRFVTVEDNRVALCPENVLIESLKKNGCPLTFNETLSTCHCVTQTCRNTCINNAITFTVDECYITFSPVVADGTELELITWDRPMGPEGYPMIAEVCVSAVTEFVMWQLCIRQRDNRAAHCEQRWYFLAREARGLMKGLTDGQMKQIGYMWMGGGAYVPQFRNNYYGYRW